MTSQLFSASTNGATVTQGSVLPAPIYCCCRQNSRSTVLACRHESRLKGSIMTWCTSQRMVGPTGGAAWATPDPLLPCPTTRTACTYQTQHLYLLLQDLPTAIVPNTVAEHASGPRGKGSTGCSNFTNAADACMPGRDQLGSKRRA
jgi:hypothetical protein